MTPAAVGVAAVAVLMAVWWVTEAIPLAATALLPIVLYPLLDVMGGGEVTRAYGHHLIFLFMGGFFIAVTMEKWGLHRRIALHTIQLVGVTPSRMVLGFMLATAFLSMWISNTAATMMMVTIGLAVVQQAGHEVEDHPVTGIDPRAGHFRFGTTLMLAIGYAATIGGIATLIGTPPNAGFAGVVEKTLGVSIGFTQWMLFALPLAAIMLLVTWLLLTRVIFPRDLPQLPGGRQAIREELAGLGRMSHAERMVAMVFALVASLWVLRGLVDIPLFKGVKDSTIAIAGAVLMFVLPVNLKRREFLLDWQTAVRIPWDVLILFGGGFALAQGFSDTGLTSFLAEQLTVLHGVDVLLIISVVVVMVIFLTELTSNTATASLLLPIMVALAGAVQVHPFGLMVPAVLAASFAFMLPVATPPNAIVFGSRYVSIRQMMRAGLWLNAVGALLITAFAYWALPLAWGFALTT